MTQGRAILASYVGVLVLAAPIFIGAGRLWFPPGLLYLAVALAGATLSHLLLPPGSDLTARRASTAREGERWDRRILLEILAVNLVAFTVAGLDAGRSGRSAPAAVSLAGAVLMLAGQLLFALARRENAFFFSTVRLEPGTHRVCDTGPYRRVRHPGYLGLVASTLAFPLVLGSTWAAPLSALAAALLVVRTSLEDRFLRENLAGYAAYALRTRWRLLPGLY